MTRGERLAKASWEDGGEQRGGRECPTTLLPKSSNPASTGAAVLSRLVSRAVDAARSHSFHLTPPVPSVQNRAGGGTKCLEDTCAVTNTDFRKLQGFTERLE